MASLIQEFEYDIFISYRQKDNKYDGWVTEFVDNLKKELEATFKEEISVYFDINPHDGLLETHDVDASLVDKLKCLVFIPIISRTYCDPKSFAWEHELKAFVEQASNDKFGLRVKLLGGNVANRVLPVRIHDLNVSDVGLFESTIGGVLRGVDFIYKSAGVNRPLRASEDHPQDNLNKTYYRDQINKVANAIEEIISSLETGQSKTGEEKAEQWEPERETGKGDKRQGLPRKAISNQKSRKWLIMMISLVMFFAGAFALYKILKGDTKSFDIAKLEKSIAVLPFINDSPDQENTYFINGIMDEILNNLQRIKEFRVLSRTSTEQYRDSNKPTIPKIAKELDVNYIVEGSGQKYGNKFVLRVQLIAANNEKHLWGESFEQEIRETSDIINLQSQIAKAIAEALKATITPEEKQLIEKKGTINLTAYDFYQRGKEEYQNYLSDISNTEALRKAEQLYKKANEYDSTFAPAYIGFANVYWQKRFYKDYFSKNFLDSVLILSDIALSFDDQSAEAHLLKGSYYIERDKPDLAILEFDKAIKYNPNYWDAYALISYQIYFFSRRNKDFVKGLEYSEKAVRLNHGKQLPQLLRILGSQYVWCAGFHEKAKYYIEEAFKLDGDTNAYRFQLAEGETAFQNYNKAIELLNKNYVRDSTDVILLDFLAYNYYMLDQSKEALEYVRKFEDRLEEASWVYYSSMKRVGYVYWQNGYKKEAVHWFDKQKEVSEKALKMGRFYSIDANYDLAAVYAFLGDKKNCYKNLKEVAKVNVCQLWLLSSIKDEPLFASIRNDEEFQQIAGEMESKYQAEHERVRKWLEEQGK